MQDLVISNSMIQYCKNASAKRKEALKLKKEVQIVNTDQKRKIEQELKMLEVKKLKLTESKDEELDMLNNNIKYLKSKLSST